MYKRLKYWQNPPEIYINLYANFHQSKIFQEIEYKVKKTFGCGTGGCTYIYNR